jgi:autotransporter-associated beta strand protein
MTARRQQSELAGTTKIKAAGGGPNSRRQGIVTMTGNHRKPTRRLAALSAGSSTLALLLAAGGMMAVTANTAFAACDATAPTTGQTVTCDTNPPNPETDGIVIAHDATDVKINILPGAIIETSGGPAIVIGASNGASSVMIGHDQMFNNQGVIRTIGDNAPAILVAPDPAPDFGDSTVVLTSVHFGRVETSGDDSPGIVYGEFGGGVSTDGSFISINISATIATAGDRSPGLVNGGVGTGQMSDAFIGMAGHHYFVTTQGHDSAGVIFNALGDTIGGTQEMLIIDSSFTVDTIGDRSPGVIFGANRTATPNTMISSFQASDIGVFVTTQGDDSVGLFFGPGATPSGDFTVAAAAIHGNIVTSGNNSHGVIITEGLSNAQPGQNVQINLAFNGPSNFMSATTSGDNAHGIILGDGLGTNRTDMNFVSALRIGNGWSATTSGAGSHALVISEHTTLTLDDANLGALTANGTIVNGTIGTFDGFVATGAGSRAVMNHGILYGTFTVGAGVVGNLGNNGLIESATGAGGVAVQFTGTTNDIFELQTEGVVIGLVEAGLGTDTFILGGAGAQTFDQTLLGTQYNDFELFEKTGSSVWTLADHSAIPLWEVREGELIVQNEFIDPIARGFTVHGGATLTLANTEPAGADTGADNRFEIHPGAIVNGNVFAGMGADTFVFGGPGMESFDVALIGTQYNDFDAFEKTGSSTWTLTGTNAATAPLLVNGGTLVNNAVLQNMAMTVNSGGTLAGIGTIGGLTLNNGGTLSPGNSIGTLTVVGNAAFNAGSTYLVEINDGGNAPGVNNDLVVAGTATIQGGAIFHVVPENGATMSTTYTPNTQYTIIQTAALGDLTVNGAPTITDTFAFLDFTGHDDGQNYYLTSSAVAASFCLPGASFNQCQTGEAVRDLGAGHIAFDAVAGMNQADANAAFNALSGEIHASGQHVIDQTFGLFSRTLRGQASAGLGGVVGGPVFTAPLAYGPSVQAGPGVVAIDDATTSANANQRVAQAWLAPLGGRGIIEADGNAGKLVWWTAGLAGGYEGLIDVASGQAYAGFGVGYLRSHGSVDARLSSFDADSFNIGAYGGWTGGPWSLVGSLAYAANRISTERRIVFGGIDQTTSADYWNHTIGFSGEAAYGFDLGAGTTISPLFTLDAGWSGHGGFTERGAGALNLTGASESWTRLDTGLGFAVQHVMLTEHGKVTLDARLLWEHAFADVVPSQNLAFAGSPTGFEVRGPDAGRDRVRLGLGVAFEATEDMTIRAGYTGLFSGNQQSHGASLGLNVKF